MLQIVQATWVLFSYLFMYLFILVFVHLWAGVHWQILEIKTFPSKISLNVIFMYLFWKKELIHI